MTTDRTLHLLVPRIFDGLEDRRRGSTDFEWPGFARLLGRAETRAAGPCGPEAVLASLFGLEAMQETDIPFGAFGRQAEAGDAGRETWACAEPVHLKPDIADVHLETASLRVGEAAALAARFNEHFEDRGMQLLPARHGQCWHLRLAEDPGIATVPISHVSGRTLRGVQSQGPAAARWESLLTEIQMLFHDAPVNHARAQQGLPEVNGLWIWGAGRLIQPVASIKMLACHDFELAANLARVAEVPLVEGTVVDFLDHEGGWPRLWADDRCGESFRRVCAEVDREIFIALDAALKRCAIDRLVIHGGGAHDFIVSAGRWAAMRAWFGFSSRRTDPVKTR